MDFAKDAEARKLGRSMLSVLLDIGRLVTFTSRMETKIDCTPLGGAIDAGVGTAHLNLTTRYYGSVPATITLLYKKVVEITTWER